MKISRRTALKVGGLSAGSLAGAGVLLAPQRAQAETEDWRQQFLDHHLPQRLGSSFVITKLISGSSAAFELWDLPSVGYMLVDANRRTMVECSDDALSPLDGYRGHDAAYLGLGEYVVETAGGRAVNALSGTPRASVDYRQFEEVTDALAANMTLSDPLSLEAPSTPEASKIPPPVGTNVRFRIPSYTYITGCNVLANTSDRCGWIAASIVMRYWHGRWPAILIPAAHRSGTNIKTVTRPDYADLIRSGRSQPVGSGLPVAEAMRYHAVVRQNVRADAWYNLLSTNVDSALNSGRPVILLGNLPSAYVNGKSINHAVVAYGKSKDGHNIVHYGYSGKSAIVLNSGVIGSNTHFLMK